jgi:Cellulose biosynthesis GIL
LNATTMIEFGNVLLPYGAACDFRTLAMLVGDLRALGNDGLRIIVREQVKVLRLAQASALTKLGVSLILPRTCDSATVRHKILSLEGTRYRDSFRRDVETVIRQARLAPTHQRMAGENFRNFAQQVVNSDGYSLPQTLVVLHPLTARESRVIDESLALGLRDGVYTVNPEGISVLLLACKPLDSQCMLERVIGPQFESLLVGWRKIGKSVDILGAIDAMDVPSNEFQLLNV